MYIKTISFMEKSFPRHIIFTFLSTISVTHLFFLKKFSNETEPNFDERGKKMPVGRFQSHLVWKIVEKAKLSTIIFAYGFHCYLFYSSKAFLLIFESSWGHLDLIFSFSPK